MDYSQQAAAASAQAGYQARQAQAYNEANLRNAQEAIKEQTEQSAAERVSQMQETDKASLEIQRHQREMISKKGTALAAAKGSGGALDALLADYERGYGQNADVIRQQLDMQGVASNISVQASKDRAEGRITSQQKYIAAPISRPNFYSAALGIGGNVLGTYGQLTNYGKNPLFASNKTNYK